MSHMFYRVLIPALMMAMPALPASAASFSLPADAVIKIKAFSFPETAQNHSGQDLPGLFQGRMADALQKAGFSIDHSAKSGEPEKTLTAAPITESGEETAKKTEEKPAADDARPTENTTEDAVAAKSNDMSGTKASGSGPQPEQAELPAGERSLLEPPSGEQTPGTQTQNDQAGAIQSVFVSQASPVPTGYTLEGQVTLLRENLSAPLRIGGGIHIRAESAIHCTYRVKDASGQAIISATASGSAARLANAQNMDAVLADLTGKVMASAAEKIASRLAGVEISSSPSSESDRDYYQDSPGKRLRKE